MATAPSLNAISESVTRFYCGEVKTLKPDPETPNRWTIHQPDGSELSTFIIRTGNRYRFGYDA